MRKCQRKPGGGWRGEISWEHFRGDNEFHCANNRGWHSQELKWSKGDRKITISVPTWLSEDINSCPEFQGYNVFILRRE